MATSDQRGGGRELFKLFAALQSTTGGSTSSCGGKRMHGAISLEPSKGSGRAADFQFVEVT